MTVITRRNLLTSGVALSASSLLGQSRLLRSVASSEKEALEISNQADIAIAPREQLLFDFGWKFTFGHGADPSKDLGFGLGQSDFPKLATSNLPKPDSMIPSGVHSTCLTIGQ